MKKIIPQNVVLVANQLKKAGFEAFLVGGCVRDWLLGKNPRDWDIATNAKPQEVQKIFPNSVYENIFGTVGVKMPSLLQEGKSEVIEVTTYRIETKYSDKRHPDEVRFAKTLQEDLSRRDFTINAMAMDLIDQKTVSKEAIQVIDYFGGQKDLKNRIVRAVGKAEERFDEDALRMMRAIRFVSELGEKGKTWKIEPQTLKAIKLKAVNLKYISKERIRDELEKIFRSNFPAQGVDLLVKTGLMQFVIPEVMETVGVKQNRHHYFGPFNTVYAHMLASLEKCPSSKLEVRLAAFLHDIGKPKTKRGQGIEATFHGHEYLGARMTERILRRLKFPRKVIEKTVLLVKNHMFYYNVDEVGEAGVRRIIKKVGLENINDLIDVRIGDRLGSGVPKAVPYKLRHFRFMVDKLSQDPISVKQLKIDGNDLIDELKMKPGPKIGAILEILLAEVIENPKINQREILLEKARDLSQEKLEQLRILAQKRIKEEKEKEEKALKSKHWVK